MKVVGTTLYGSQNYLLSTSESDRDYKVVVTPNFDELYMKKDLNGSGLPAEYTDTEHYSCMDIRTFAANLAKGNPNAIEMLFSTEIHGDESFLQLLEAWREPYFDGYVASRWDYFTKAIDGIIYNSFKRFGITPKTASRALYFIKLTDYIADNNFKIDNSVLRAPEVYTTPRAIRLEQRPFDTTTVDGISVYRIAYINAANSAETPDTFGFNPDVFITPTKEFVRRNM